LSVTDSGDGKHGERTQRCNEVFVHGVPRHVPLQGEKLMRSSHQKLKKCAMRRIWESGFVVNQQLPSTNRRHDYNFSLKK